MKNQVNEYKNAPILSDGVREVMKNYNGGPISPEIRLEMEQYLNDVQPFLESGYQRIKERFDRIFK